MTEQQGLTGIKEEARGFVGRRGLKYDETKKGRSRMKFDIASGISDYTNNKYPTWRHCVAYDALADKLKDIKPGDLVKVAGYIVTEAILDEYYKPKKDSTGEIITVEYLICKSGMTAEHQKLQKRLSLEVGQAS